MADNYLERRMEDLRNGRLHTHKTPSRTASMPKKKGYLHIPFPPRRVLVTGDADGIGPDIIRAFLKADCKVALFNEDKETGERLATEEGVRFYHVDPNDYSTMDSAMANLMEAWRDIDVAVSLGDNLSAEPLANIWCQHRRMLPLPNPFGGRMIVIPSANIDHLTHILSEFNITVNGLSYRDIKAISTEAIVRLVLFLSAPEIGIIHNTDIFIA